MAHGVESDAVAEVAGQQVSLGAGPRHLPGLTGHGRSDQARRPSPPRYRTPAGRGAKPYGPGRPARRGYEKVDEGLGETVCCASLTTATGKTMGRYVSSGGRNASFTPWVRVAASVA